MAGDTLEWEEAVELLATLSGVVLVVGPGDSGKSTLALAAANAAVQAGRRPAILDADVGQGEIGPPGTLGLIRLEAPAAGLDDLRPRALAFVGETFPVGHLLAVVQGAARLARHARERGDDVLYVDTSGLVSGRIAEKLKLAKAAVLDPGAIVLIQRERELERLARLLESATEARVVRVRRSPLAAARSAAYRRVRRATRLGRHLQGARLQDLDAGQVAVVDGWPFTGTPLTGRQLQRAEAALQTGVPYGEITADGLYLCAAGRADRRGLTVLQEEFGTRRIVVTPAVAFRNLLVGLYGPEGHLLEIGLLQGVNFDRALFSLLTPARSLGEVRTLHFGRLRARPDGSEIAHLRPGDL